MSLNLHLPILSFYIFSKQAYFCEFGKSIPMSKNLFLIISFFSSLIVFSAKDLEGEERAQQPGRFPFHWAGLPRPTPQLTLAQGESPSPLPLDPISPSTPSRTAASPFVPSASFLLCHDQASLWRAPSPPPPGTCGAPRPCHPHACRLPMLYIASSSC